MMLINVQKTIWKRHHLKTSFYETVKFSQRQQRPLDGHMVTGEQILPYLVLSCAYQHKIVAQKFCLDLHNFQSCKIKGEK